MRICEGYFFAGLDGSGRTTRGLKMKQKGWAVEEGRWRRTR